MKDYRRNPLWSALVETAKKLPSYERDKEKTMDEILPRKPDITPEELAEELGIPLGEAMVILDEARLTPEEVEEKISEKPFKPKYRLIALGGTFGKLHYGHLMLLYTGVKNGEKVIVGVTTDEFAEKLGKEYEVPSFEERVKRLRAALEERGWMDRCEIIPLSDPYGIAAEDPGLEALVTSPFTRRRGDEINKLRIMRGLKPLDVIVCPLVVARDGKPISSTRIARGEITPNGNLNA